MPARDYLPLEGFMNLKKVYDSESLQDHWFFVLSRVFTIASRIFAAREKDK